MEEYPLMPRPSTNPVRFLVAFLSLAAASAVLAAGSARPNVLFIIADDLTLNALSCYGNSISRTPNIDRIAARGTRFTRAYCNATYCGPSRASFMSGYYPHAAAPVMQANPRRAIGERATWSQHFRQGGYHAARISKIYHMGVPGGIEYDGDAIKHNHGNGADDAASWNERYNSPGPEWKAAGAAETLESNPDGRKQGAVGGNTFVVIEADGTDHEHSDGKTTAKAVELLQRFGREHQSAPGGAKPFFLAVGFVRPHVPFVAPKVYFKAYLPYDKMPLPPKIPGDWDDIPKAGINYKTSVNMKMDVRRQQKAVGGYYAAVAFMDAQIGKVLDALRTSGLEENTIVIFTSDHGYHLGEHDFWAKVSLRDESAQVPLIVSVPGRKPAVCSSLVELIDLYPTTARLCGLDAPSGLQGKDISRLLDDPKQTVRDAVFTVAPSQNAFLIRENRWAYLQYGEDAAQGIELFDVSRDPKQYTNLAGKPEHAPEVARLKSRLAATLRAVRTNDLDKP
jgi:iduronate 2-sulfatase